MRTCSRQNDVRHVAPGRACHLGQPQSHATVIGCQSLASSESCRDIRVIQELATVGRCLSYGRVTRHYIRFRWPSQISARALEAQSECLARSSVWKVVPVGTAIDHGAVLLSRGTSPSLQGRVFLHADFRSSVCTVFGNIAPLAVLVISAQEVEPEHSAG